jgi:glycyl-tRNA synthetase beta chain
MAELLFEILCEEIPAGMQVRAGDNLAKALTDGLGKAGLKVENAQTLTGPRRLTFVAEVPLRSPDISEERKGPRVGAPEQAIAGFLRGAGVASLDECETRSDKKGDYYVAMIEKQGQEAADVLAALIPNVMNNFPWPKSMKSGTSDFRWVRPLQSLLCLLDGKTVDFEVGGLKSSNTTEGHRRMGRGPFTIKDFADYKKTLEGKGHVILSADDRKALILKNAEAACKEAGLELVDDPGLLDEVAGLAEWPVVILGDMDPSFLELPGEVIRLSMRSHQKYFAVRDPKSGELAPKFIVVANQVAPDGGKAIAAGNSRVLSARLDDAKFSPSEDAKRTLESRFDELAGVMFHRDLGTIKEKMERVAILAGALSHFKKADPSKVAKAAILAKCDLVTNMVVEFTTLQGKIGRLMYENEGGDADVAIAIEDHYRPQGAGDRVPDNPVAITLALADKIDTLAGFWVIGEKPTGSKDPFALRRTALGLIRTLLENKIRLNLLVITTAATTFVKTGAIVSESQILVEGDILHKNVPKREQMLEKRKTKLIEDIEEYESTLSSSLPASSPEANDLFAFIVDRLKVHLRDQGVKHDLVDAVFALGEDDLVAVVNRVEALQSFLATDDGANLLAGYKRAANILKAEAKKGDLPDVKPGKGTQAEETALFTAMEAAKPAIEKALAKEDYAGAMTALSKLRAPIDAFFDKVTVNAENADERANRLALLTEIRNTAHSIADFDKIEG